MYLEMGKTRRRYIFQVLNVLSFTDYEIGVGMGIGNVHKYVGEEEGFSLTKADNYKAFLRRPASRNQFVFLSDQQDLLSASPGWKKKVYVDPDCFGEGEDAFSVPFGVHPAQVLSGRDKQLDEYRAQDTKVTLLFAGACQPEGYATDAITKLFGKVPRSDLYESICQVLDGGDYTTTRDADSLLNAEDKIDAALFVLATDGVDNRVARENWFRVLAAADFFVAGPGVYMPMSHNVIEALAVGTIPIIEYPELFSPDLSVAQACITFRGRQEFEERIRSCVEMEPSARANLKKTAMDYYDTHLSPKAAGRKLQREVLDRPTNPKDDIERIIINAEHESVDLLSSKSARGSDV